jgi:hypothetical protein
MARSSIAFGLSHYCRLTSYLKYAAPKFKRAPPVQPQPSLFAWLDIALAPLNRFAIYFSRAFRRKASLTVINPCHRFSLPSGKEERNVEAKIQGEKMVATDYVRGVNYQSVGSRSAAAGVGRLK